MNIKFAASVGRIKVAYADWNFKRKIKLPLLLLRLNSGAKMVIKVDREVKQAVIDVLSLMKPSLSGQPIQILGYDFTWKELDSRDIKGSYSVGDLDIDTEKEVHHLKFVFSGIIFQDNLSTKRVNFPRQVETQGWY